jgi:UDP-N-acetylglucosamine:LPS N-acetylglucosamine transferase
MPALAGRDVAYLTTDPEHRVEVAPARFYAVRDANRWNKLQLLRSALRVLWIVLRERPAVIVSTGAAPGYVAIRLGKLLGARTIWIDSIANVEELSLSGRLASRAADVCLTQWPHLAGGSVDYRGAVL